MARTMDLVKDVRGSMTRFDPLTPEIVAEQSEDGLTYQELKEVLSVCGMDIDKVVFDGSRRYQNAFFADFEQGHYHAEHEVILKPGVKPQILNTDMIPSTQSYVPQLLTPVTKDFFHYGSIALTLGYPEENMFQYHGIKHILRVLLLTLIYCEHSCMELSEEDKQILIYFSLLHDIGRDSEGEDETHGDKSVELIRKKNIRIRGMLLSKKGYRIAKLLIRHHCRDDNSGTDRVTKVPGFTAKDIVRAFRLYRIAKDMDGLDRVRFNGLDFRYLRTPYARRLPLIAGGLLEEPLLECIKRYRDGKLEVPNGL